MKKQFQSKSVPRGTRTIWRYLGALFILFTFAIGNVWGEVVGKNTSTTGTIIYSNINSTGSNVNLTAGTEENGFNAISGASFKSGPGVISVAADGYFALCVDDITEGTVYHTMTVTSNVPDWTSTSGGSNGRYAQLYIGDTGAKKYLYTKYSTNTTVEEATGLTKEGSNVRGIYSFSFTSSDLTTIGTKKYLKFKALGGEYKPAGFKIVASTTPAVDTQAPTLSSSDPEDGDTDVAVEGTIVLTFSEALASVDGTKFSLSGATIGTVAKDGSDATKVNVPYSGASNSATVTLSVTKDAVADAAGNKSAALSNIVFTTVAASSGGGEDPEPTCPTEGQLYSAVTTATGNISIATTTGLELNTSTHKTTVFGGKMYVISGQSSNKNLITNGAFCQTNDNTFFKIELDCALAAGDVISINVGKDGSNDRGVWVSTATSKPSSAPACALTAKSSSLTPKTYVVTSTDEYVGKKVFYIYRATANSTYFNNVVITRPYSVSYAELKEVAHTMPTKAVEFTLQELTHASFTHLGWTADKLVKVGGADKAAGTALAVDATVELTDNTTFTATWEAKAATFAVTYKANNGTSEADINDPAASTFAANTFTVPDGKMFAGWNTQADGEGTNYAVDDAVTEAITVYAKWVVDPTIRLIKNDGTLNTVNFVTGGTLKDDGPFTVEAVEYAKNVQFGNSCSGVSSIDNLNKAVIYHSTTNATKVTIVAYNNYTGGSTANLLYAVVPEGTTTASAITKTLNKSTGGVYEVNMTGRSTLYIYAGHKEVRICQVSVEENGTANAVAPAVGYSVNLNKQRPFLTSGAVTEFEGIEYKVSSNYKPLNGQVQIQTLETNYISFEIPEGETRQLQLTTSNTNKYTVSKILGDNTESKKVSGNQNINLTAGTWYINPQGSNVNITNITFAAAPDPLTVTFKDGESTLSEQALFVGDKVAEPEAPTKTGYRFDKWQRSGADYDFDYTLVAGDAPGFTLDAVWQKTWKVTFDADNGSDPVVVTVDNNQAVAQPVNPEKAGFDFVEWQSSGSAYNFATLVTGDITLTATWEVAQDDASLSALSYNGNAIDVASAEEVSGVQTYTYHLPWGSTIDPALVSVTKNAETATVGSITYDSENNRISFVVESGNHSVLINYAIQFVIDAKRGTSIVKATTNNVVTGLIGGTIDQSYSGNANFRKLNKGNYFGVTLANDETFQEGDVFIVNITTSADLGKFMIYADKNRTELVADQGIVYTKPEVADPVICPTGEMRLVLPAAATGKKSLYLSRENSDNSPQWNVTFSYVEVTREMNPAIKSFKFGDDAATINESAKTISIDVPYGTDVTALTPTVEAYGNNGATYTPAGATDFTSPVDYVVTDGYSEYNTTYAVTVNVAAPSTNAYLASLSVAGYALDFNKETTTYNIVLDYGTTVLPTITYEVEDAGLATAEKVEGGVNGETTITVTPQAGAGYEKVYTINFSVSTNPKYVIYDGSTMTNIASATGADGSTGFSYSLASNIPLSGDAISSSWGGKDYTHAIKGFKPNDNSSNIVSFVIPEGYVAKVRLVGSTNSNTKERKLFIAMSASKDAADALNNYIITSSTYDAQGFVTDYLLPNTYYLGSTDSYRLFEFSIQLYPIDEERAMTQGRFGTICYPNGGRLLGAMLLEIAYFDPDQKKIFFDEVIGGQMVAGAPYLFLPNEGVDKFAIVYTDNVNASAGHHNGLYGSYTQEALPTDGNHYIMLNNQYCKVVEANTYVGANRAYIQLDKIGNDYLAPAYGRRRVSLGVQQAEVATGLEDLNVGDQPIKIMINGQMYILRGEKMYDATGRLVK